MKSENMKCETCKHCYPDGLDWVCTNPDSEYYADWVDYKHWCEDWEGKQKTKQKKNNKKYQKQKQKQKRNKKDV